jgi:hypothetical protein
MSCTKLASLVMKRGDPREAAAIGTTAVALSGELTSRRAADDLRQLGQLAGRHSKVPEALALKESIATTLAART